MARSSVRRRDNRAYVNQIKSQATCRHCGSTQNLVFHHVDGSTKEYGVAELVHSGYTINRIKKEIAKCIILCNRCHSKLHAKQRRAIRIK